MVLVAALAACGGVNDTTKHDAAVTPDTPMVDAGMDAFAARCSKTAAFQAPIEVMSINDSTENVEHAWLSADELRVYFSSTRTGTLGGFDLFMASRANRTAEFSNIVPVMGVNTAGQERQPRLTSDERVMYALTGTSPNYQISMTSRASTSATFPAFQEIAALNSTSNDEPNWILPDDSALYFDSNKNGDYDLFRAPKSNGTLGNAVPVNGTNINTASTDASAVVTADELTMFFASDRPNGAGGQDIWITQRTSLANGFDDPTNLQVANTGGVEQPSWISADGCVLYFMRGPPPYKVFSTTRGM
jgi:hypothetical protein